MIEVLYSDNHIIVVNKLAGIPTQAEEGESVESQVKLWAKEHYEKKGAVFVHAAHRLDKPVGGIVVLAKTSKALSRLQESFRSKEVQKTYIAWVEGVLKEESALLEDYLLHEEFRSSVCFLTNPKGKRASLSYRVKAKTAKASLVEIDLHTGRYHQIRLQFSHRGHPIVNDLKYGGSQVTGVDSIALQHAKVIFPHPISKEKLVFEVPFPSKWGSLVK